MSVSKVEFIPKVDENGKFSLIMDGKFAICEYDDGEFVYDPYLGYYNDVAPEPTVRGILNDWELKHFLQRMEVVSVRFESKSVSVDLRTSKKFKFYNAEDECIELENFNVRLVSCIANLGEQTREFIMAKAE